MNFYIKEGPNKLVTLMTEGGVVLGTFRNVDEARSVWQDWRKEQKDWVWYHLVV